MWGNRLYFTIILTFIPKRGKSGSYKHSLIIYLTAYNIPFYLITTTLKKNIRRRGIDHTLYAYAKGLYENILLYRTQKSSFT